MSSAAFVTPEEAASDRNAAGDATAGTSAEAATPAPAPSAATQEEARSPAPNGDSAPVDAALPGVDLSDPAVQAAAVKIQSGFRGLQARTRVNQMKYPNLYPYSGPLAPAVLPPRKVARNPVFVGLTTGRNSQCGCPGAHRHTIHFDTHGFPARLTGIYTEESWVELLHELNDVLSDTHLPLCPSALLWICPVLGACAWWNWKQTLRERRMQQLRAILRRESEALSPWGLQWKLKPLWGGVHEGRGDMSRVQIDLVMTRSAQSAVRRTMRRSLSMSMSRRASQLRDAEADMPAAPKQQTMEASADTKQQQDTAQLIAVQPKATSGPEG